MRLKLDYYAYYINSPFPTPSYRGLTKFGKYIAFISFCFRCYKYEFNKLIKQKKWMKNFTKDYYNGKKENRYI